jgi:RNA polymerase sigma factor (sigma-70 family)
LEKLPQTYREIVMLKDIENLSYKEIAEVVEIPIGTVMSRLARGRKLLGEYLQKCGVGEIQ